MKLSLKSLFKKRDPSHHKVPAPQYRHDFRSSNQYWGHALIITKSYGDEKTGNLADCNGHVTPRAKVGDQVILSMDSGKDAVWVFLEVKNRNDPKDMFFAKIGVLGYLEDVEDMPELTPRKKLQSFV